MSKGKDRVKPMLSRREALKLLGLGAGAFVLGDVVGAKTARAATVLSDKTVLSKYTTMPYDILVGLDSSGQAYAIDKKGNLIARGVSHASIIQDVINGLNYQPKGGLLYISRGEFNFNKTSISKNDMQGLHLVGSGFGHDLGLGTRIVDGGFDLEGVGTVLRDNVVRDVEFYNTDNTMTALKLVRPDQNVIDRVMVHGYDTGIVLDNTSGGLDNIIINSAIFNNNIGLKIVGDTTPIGKVIGTRITNNTTNIQIGTSTQPAPWNVKFIGCDIEAGNIVIDGTAVSREIRDISIISSYLELVSIDLYANPYIMISLIDNYIEYGNPLNINVHSGTVLLNVLNRNGEIILNVDSGATLIVQQYDYGYYKSVWGLGVDYHGTDISKGTISGTLKILTPGTVPYVTTLPATGDEPGQQVLYYDGTYYYLAVWNGSAWVKVQLS